MIPSPHIRFSCPLTPRTARAEADGPAQAERLGGVPRYTRRARQLGGARAGCVMLPLLILAGIFLATGIIVGRFRTPRAIDARMTVGALMVFSGVIFLVQGLFSH